MGMINALRSPAGPALRGEALTDVIHTLLRPAAEGEDRGEDSYLRIMEVFAMLELPAEA